MLTPGGTGVADTRHPQFNLMQSRRATALAVCRPILRAAQTQIFNPAMPAAIGAAGWHGAAVEKGGSLHGHAAGPRRLWPLASA
jgi:hypothetical protein